MDLHMAAQMDARRAAVVGHGPQVFLEDLQVDDHAGRGEIFFIEMLKIAAGHARLDFIGAVCGAG